MEPDSAFARVVGARRGLSEIELDPLAAWRRGRILDAQLQQALPPHPRGVWRGTFEQFARMDEVRMLSAARRVDGQ